MTDDKIRAAAERLSKHRGGRPKRPPGPCITPVVLRQMRKDAEMSQMQMASALGVHHRTIYDWEHAAQQPSVTEARVERAIANYRLRSDLAMSSNTQDKALQRPHVDRTAKLKLQPASDANFQTLLKSIRRELDDRPQHQGDHYWGLSDNEHAMMLHTLEERVNENTTNPNATQQEDTTNV
jgi:DNA-binding transcriptional regulator YiaG